ncbi:MAG: ABC transporter substrate-binding protein, partial [Salinibacterium sp.]|nr:ABC transporter substrate-binding protein [Salinibacterium sp.]
SATQLLDQDVSVIVGAISEGVSKKVIDQIVGAGVIQMSPGSSSLDFSRYADSDLYWRTSPSCAREGAALGQHIADSGAKTLGIVYQTGYCDPGLPEAIADTFERAGGEVVARTEFDAAATSVSAQVAEVVAEKPQAVAIVTPTLAKLAVPDLTAAGFTGDSLYFVGLGIADQSADFAAGSLTGATATLPGLDIATLGDFTDRLLGVNPALIDFSYAAEAYDGVILVALAALAAGDTSGAAIAGKLQEVSGGSGEGEKATSFEDAAGIILSGDVVDYDGPSGSIDFDENGDPASAVIGLYAYGADNAFLRIN